MVVTCPNRRSKKEGRLAAPTLNSNNQTNYKKSDARPIDLFKVFSLRGKFSWPAVL